MRLECQQCMSDIQYKRMQKQMPRGGSFLQEAIYYCSEGHSLSQQEIKFILLNLATKIDKIERIGTTNKPQQDNVTPQDDMLEKIQCKLVEIEERRKVWDATMAEIFNEKQLIQSALKVKMERIDQLEKYIRSEMQKIRNNIKQVQRNNEEDRNALRIIALDKIEKVKKEFGEELGKKYTALKVALQEQYNRKQKSKVKFSVTCSSMVGEQQANKAPMDTKNQIKYEAFQDQEVKKLDNLVKQKHCKNVEIVIKNFNALQSLQSQLLAISPTIQRFAHKIMNLGTKIEVIEEKLADMIPGSRQKQSMEKKEVMMEPRMMAKGSENNRPMPPPQHLQPANNKQPVILIDSANLLLRTAKYFKKFIVENNVITYAAEGDGSCMLLGCQPLRTKNTFTIEVVHSQKNYISVGIVDEKYQEHKDCWERQNFIMMRGVKGQVYCGPNNKIKDTGAEFKSGSVVKLQVDFYEGNVMWYINNKLESVYKTKKVLDLRVQWVPLVRFYSNYDSIKWIA